MGEKIKVKLYDVQTIEVTPQLLAEALYAMDNIEQVEFFEAMGEIWVGKDFDTQMAFVGMQSILSDRARDIMKVIGNHSQR